MRHLPARHLSAGQPMSCACDVLCMHGQPSRGLSACMLYRKKLAVASRLQLRAVGMHTAQRIKPGFQIRRELASWEQCVWGAVPARQWPAKQQHAYPIMHPCPHPCPLTCPGLQNRGGGVGARREAARGHQRGRSLPARLHLKVLCVHHLQSQGTPVYQSPKPLTPLFPSLQPAGSLPCTDALQSDICLEQVYHGVT